jgi:hypothetical protein
MFYDGKVTSIDSGKLERLVELGLSPSVLTDPEFAGLREELEELEETRRKRDPKVIGKEMADYFSVVCGRDLPRWVHHKVSFEIGNNPMSGRLELTVDVEATHEPAYPNVRALGLPDEVDAAIRTERVDRLRVSFAVSELPAWRTEAGEARIRGHIRQVVVALSRTGQA